MLQLRKFLARHLAYHRRNSDYSVSQMLLALIYSIILGLDRIETASLLRSDRTFQYLTGLQSFPDPQTLRRFLLNAPAHLREQLHRANDRLLQRFIHLPEHRSRLILDLDSTVLTVFGHQEGAAVGYNPRYRGKRSYDPLLCLEANSSFLWDVGLRRGDAGTWAGSEELLACCFHSTPSDIRELRVRADAGFGYGPVLEMLETRPAQYAVVARMIPSLKRELRGLPYEPMNPSWEMAEFEHRPHDWSQARRCIVARRKIEEADPQPTLFTLERHAYRAWHTNLPLTPAGVWHFYDGRAELERGIREFREDFALRKIPTRAFAANALYLEVIRLAYNLVTAFQRTCLPEEWQSLTLSKLRHRLFWLPGELTRPQNRPTLRLPTPRIFTGLAHGDLDSASQAMQVFLQNNVFPPKLEGFPWVVYDAWGTQNEGLEKALLAEIDFAADLGIEVFYHDAAWYAGSSRTGNGDWFTGLGSYEQDPEKFPHGLANISSRVHERGMKFGLWVDCAMIDGHLVPKEIPEKWLALRDGKQLSISYKPYNASIIQLCLGDPEVVEHVGTQLGRLIRELHLDWIKWDTSGESGICNRTDHGHQAGDGAYAAERGRYSLWSVLHKNFPDLVLEECGGVTRQDLGLAPYCRSHWMDDATFPSRHVRENIMSVSFVYPCYYQGSWVTREEEIGDTKDQDVLDTIFRSRMVGLFGFGTLYGKLPTERVSLFPPETLEAARRNIPVYKRYRHLLSENCFHLTPPAGSPEGWQAIEFCKRDGSEAVVLAFRNESSQNLYALPLKGLNARNQYRVESANSRTSITRLGAQLSSEGAILDLPKPMMSEILFLTLV